MYTVRVVVPTSRCKILPIWIHTDVLEHAVLHTAVSTQTSDVCDALTWVPCGNSARSLESLCILPTHTIDGYDSSVALWKLCREGKD